MYNVTTVFRRENGGKSTSAPRISVIIPYYEGPRWLPLSAASALAQEGVDLELLVVDDGSASPASAVTLPRDERVRFISVPHAGKGAAVNRGVAEASGVIICVLDQDDLMLPGRLSRQLAVLETTPGADAVYSDYERVTEDGKLIDVFKSRSASAREMLHAMASATGLISMQTMLIRKASLQRLGGFSADPDLTGLDDGEFFARLIASGAKLLYVPGLVARWVSHPANYSKQEQFNAARTVFLRRLSELASLYPMLRTELGYFRAHALYMRGLYCLEHGRPAEAADEFLEALKEKPFSAGAIYLYFKARFLALSAGEEYGK